MATHVPEQKMDRTRVRQTVSNVVERVTYTNVAPGERWLSALGGGALAFYALFRRDWLGGMLAVLGGWLLYRGASGHSFLYQALKKNTAENPQEIDLSALTGKEPVCVQRSLTINRPSEDLYTFWRQLENSSRYIPGVVAVEQTGKTTSHWLAEGPGGKTYEWDAEIIEDEPGHMLAWRTHGKPIIASTGRVTFTPASGGRGTVVTLSMDYIHFKGVLGKIVGRVSDFEALEILRRFKELTEAGEVASTAGQPDGRAYRKGGARV